MRERIPKIVMGVVLALAVVRASLGKKPDAGAPITDALAHDVYRDITSREHAQRREAAVKFPGDLWSQDDDFHERVNEMVRSTASSKEVRLGDVLRSLDDGMRSHWQASAQPQATVPPCRPRLSY